MAGLGGERAGVEAVCWLLLLDCVAPGRRSVGGVLAPMHCSSPHTLIAHSVGYVPVENPPPRGGGAGRRAQLAPKFSCAAGGRENKGKV